MLTVLSSGKNCVPCVHKDLYGAERMDDGSLFQVKRDEETLEIGKVKVKKFVEISLIQTLYQKNLSKIFGKNLEKFAPSLEILLGFF